jgi:transcription elongation GreA/GreB family factor
VLLRELGSGRQIAATILGPWDSRPEDGIYSYESEFARHLLGKKTGEGVRLPDGGAAEIASIDPWR